jgi:hypothetical protein
MKKVSIKYKWDEALALCNVLHMCCNMPTGNFLQPASKMLFAQLQAMYLKLAPKVLVHKPTVRVGYDAVSAFALIAFYCNHNDDDSLMDDYTKHVLRSTVGTLDQGFA